jgi:hypothetical protein
MHPIRGAAVNAPAGRKFRSPALLARRRLALSPLPAGSSPVRGRRYAPNAPESALPVGLGLRYAVAEA